MTSLIRLGHAYLVVAVSLAGNALVVPTAGATTATATGATDGPSPHGPPSTLGRAKKKPRAKARAGTSRNKRHHHSRRRAAAAALAVNTPPATPLKIAAVAPLAPSPGPRLTPEALRAQEQVTRNQIERAESAARRPELSSRWETVSFLLSGVDEARYPEAGFWRALASYRRGDIEGGDGVRNRSQLAPRDLAALDDERTVASMLAARASGRGRDDEDASGAAPAPAPAGFQRAAFVDGDGASRKSGVHNNAPYTGPAPTAVAPGLAAAN